MVEGACQKSLTAGAESGREEYWMCRKKGPKKNPEKNVGYVY